MRSSRIWALLVIALLVAVNVWVFYPATSKPRSLAEAKLEFVENERRTWADSDVIPLGDEALESIIEKMQSDQCFELPRGAVPVSVAELSDDARRDLPVAVAGLCRAYLTDTAKAVVEYMRERGETLGPVNSQQWRQILQKQGHLVPPLGGDDDDLRLAEAFWLSADNGAHWELLRPGGSCWRVYRVSQYGEEIASSLGKIETGMWDGVKSYRHRFTAKHTVPDELRSTGTLLLCDVKLVIDHDESLRSITVPYYVRFWWSTADHRWHPLDLGSMPIDLMRMRLTVKLMF